MPFKRRCANGFTLVELIISIVVLAISFSIITQFLLPSATSSASQIHQIRAAELGQSLMNEIMGRAFDENSDHVGGAVRCGEGGTTCTAAVGALGPDEANREDFNDVDDYIGNIDAEDLENTLGNNIGSLYQGYNVDIKVFYDGNYDGADDGVIAQAKLIRITITTPANEQIVFATYKVNF